MWYDTTIRSLSETESYTRSDLFGMLKQEKPELSYSTFQWLIYSLQKNNLLHRTGYDSYSSGTTNEKVIYQPLYSEEAAGISSSLSMAYPLVDFTVFESTLLNEFLNQLIAQNTIYLQVNRDVSSYIFEWIRAHYDGSVLYKPSEDDFFRYWQSGSVVILDKISESPANQDAPHDILLEKLLVDILAEKTIQATFSPSEYPFIFENALRMYRIDKKKMMRYARRRNRGSEIQKYLEETHVI